MDLVLQYLVFYHSYPSAGYTLPRCAFSMTRNTMNTTKFLLLFGINIILNKAV